MEKIRKPVYMPRINIEGENNIESSIKSKLDQPSFLERTKWVPVALVLALGVYDFAQNTFLKNEITYSSSSDYSMLNSNRSETLSNYGGLENLTIKNS